MICIVYGGRHLDRMSWASLKSVRANDRLNDTPEGAGPNVGVVDFHGQKRKNDTHFSSIDPESRLYRKARDQPGPLLLSCADVLIDQPTTRLRMVDQ